MSDYNDKYIKYKKKYLKMKMNMVGGEQYALFNSNKNTHTYKINEYDSVIDFKKYKCKPKSNPSVDPTKYKHYSCKSNLICSNYNNSNKTEYDYLCNDFDESNNKKFLEKLFNFSGRNIINENNACYCNAVMQCICAVIPYVFLICNIDIDECDDDNENESLLLWRDYIRSIIMNEQNKKENIKKREEIRNIVFKNIYTENNDALEFVNKILDKIQNCKIYNKKISNMFSVKQTETKKIKKTDFINLVKNYETINKYEIGDYEFDKDEDVYYKIKTSEQNYRMLYSNKKEYTTSDLSKPDIEENYVGFKFNEETRKFEIQYLSDPNAKTIIELTETKYEYDNILMVNAGAIVATELGLIINERELINNDYYYLFAVCVYYQGYENSGHYVSYVKQPKYNNEKEKWFFYNDQIKEEVEKTFKEVQDECKNNAYLLFYIKKNYHKIIFNGKEYEYCYDSNESKNKK